jgi:hypothetical protein
VRRGGRCQNRSPSEHRAEAPSYRSASRRKFPKTCALSTLATHTSLQSHGTDLVYSPLETTFKPQSCWNFTTSATDFFSRGSSSSGLALPAATSYRFWTSSCGLRREPTCSARKGGVLLRDDDILNYGLLCWRGELNQTKAAPLLSWAPRKCTLSKTPIVMWRSQGQLRSIHTRAVG